MTDPAQRRKLAERTTEIYRAGGKSYTQSLDQALGELNPAKDKELGEKLLYALLNVPERVRHAKRLSPRAPAVTEAPEPLPGASEGEPLPADYVPWDDFNPPVTDPGTNPGTNPGTEEPAEPPLEPSEPVDPPGVPEEPVSRS